MKSFFKNLFQHFAKCNSTEKGSSLAYYAVFSLFPMIMIIVSLLGMFFGEQAVKGEIFIHLQNIIGDAAAMQIENLIRNQHIDHRNILTTIIGFATLAISASGMLIQIHSSFNSIWQSCIRQINLWHCGFRYHVGFILAARRHAKGR